MTTIAYHHKDKTISVDSRTTQGNLISTDEANKVVRNGIGVWFVSGLVADAPYLTMLNHNDKPSVELGCSALLIKNSVAYLVTILDGFCIHTQVDYNISIGSGSDFALAAMDFGKGSKDAIKYAMTRDSATGGKIQTVKVK